MHLRTWKLLNYTIAAIWLINGLYCKVLNRVPRHQGIVERILSVENGGWITKTIGIAEIFMAIWILSEYKSKMNALAQIGIIALMNSIEFILAPDLLLWGKFNAFFAFLLILLIYYNSFILRNSSKVQIS